MDAVEDCAIDVNARDGDGCTALHMCCDVADLIGTGSDEPKGDMVEKVWLVVGFN